MPKGELPSEINLLQHFNDLLNQRERVMADEGKRVKIEGEVEQILAEIPKDQKETFLW